MSGKAAKPKTGNPEVLTIPEPVELPTSKDPQTGLLYGQDRYGNIYRVSPEDYAKGEYQPVDPDTADKVTNYRAELDKLSPLSLGYSVARGLSGRLTDVPLAALTSPEEASRYTEGVGEKYPVSSTLAEALGMVGPLLIPGVGEARLATAPGLFEAAGGLAGRGLAEAGPLSEAARWGTEGALWGASHDISRQTLEGKPLDWDKLWDATSGSALFAGVLGGGIGTLAGRFGKAREAAAEGAAKVAPTGAPEEAITAQKAVFGPEAHPGGADLMFEVGQPGRGSAELLAKAKRDPNVAKLALADEAENAVQQHALKTSESLEAAMRIGEEYPTLAGGNRKMTQYRAALKNIDPRAAEQATLEKLQEFSDEARSIGESAQLAPRKSVAKNVADYADSRIEQLKSLADSKDYTAELAGELEQLKRYAQTETAKAGGAVKSWDEWGAMLERNGDPNQPGSIASILQDSRLWGEHAAKMNEEINAAVHKQLYRSKVVESAFGQNLGEPSPNNPYRAFVGIDPTKVSTMLEKLDSPLRNREFQILKDYAHGAEELGTTMRKYYEMSPEQSARLAQWEKRAGELDKILEKAKEDVTIINQFRKVGIGDPHTEARIMGFAGGGLLGHMTGIPGASLIGGAAGSTIGTLLNPLGKIRTAAALRRRINDYDGWKAKLIDFLAGTKWAGKSLETHAVPEILAHEESPRKMMAAARTLLYGAFREHGDDNVSAMERQLEHIASATPAKVKEGVTTWLGPAANEYPAAVDHMTQKIMRAQEVLLQQAPTRSQPDGMGFASWFKMPPDHSELQRFEEVWTAVLKPRAVLSMSKADELSPDTVDILNYVHPDLMADFRVELQSSLAQGTAPKSTDRRRTLSILFGVPMDPTMEPEYIDLMQTMHETRDQITDAQMSKNQYRDRGTGRPSGVNIGTRGDELEEAHGGGGAEG